MGGDSINTENLSTMKVRGRSSTPPLSTPGNAVLYFDKTAGKLYISEDGSAFAEVGGGGGGATTPGDPDTSIQFNNGGVFGGSSNLLWDDINKTLYLTATPAASSSRSLFCIGNHISGGSSNGTYIGLNTGNTFGGDIVNLQRNGNTMFQISNVGALALGANGVSSGSISLSDNGTGFTLTFTSNGAGLWYWRESAITGARILNLDVANKSVHIGHNTSPTGTDTLEVYDATATTGVTSVRLKAGAGQSATPVLTSEGVFEFAQVAALGTVGANSGRIGVLDVAGTGEFFAKDGAGNEVQLTAHAMDGPPWLYDAGDPLPQVFKEVNYYLGIVRRTNRSRQARLLERMFAGENIAALPVEQRTFIHTEALPPELIENWDENQQRAKIAREREIALRELRKVERAREISVYRELKARVERGELKLESLTPEEELILSKEPELFDEPEIPAYRIKPIPAWINERLERAASGEEIRLAGGDSPTGKGRISKAWSAVKRTFGAGK